MVKLECVLVGIRGTAFSVEIDPEKLVGGLKKVIKKVKGDDLKAVNADKIRLFLAKKDDSWLDTDNDNAKALFDGKVPPGILDKEIDPTLEIRAVFADVPVDGVHVLIVTPQYYYHDSTSTIPQFTEFVHVRPIPASVLLENSTNPGGSYSVSNYGRYRHYFRSMEPLNLFTANDRDGVNKEFGIDGRTFRSTDTISSDNTYFVNLKAALRKSKCDGVKMGTHENSTECYVDANKLELFLIAVYDDVGNGGNNDDNDDGVELLALAQNSWTETTDTDSGSEAFQRDLRAEATRGVQETEDY